MLHTVSRRATQLHRTQRLLPGNHRTPRRHTGDLRSQSHAPLKNIRWP